MGSSPLARGLRGPAAPAAPAAGIIPARAGFTEAVSWTPCTWRDHPRSRGVYQAGVRRLSPRNGSSPLARGLHREGALADGRSGIIPARAGFTRVALGAVMGVGDHPRSRGVYRLGRGGHGADPGSSPLARGLRVLSVAVEAGARIIPARAGFTFYHFAWPSSNRDHPRSRGVYRGQDRGEGERRGIIPARAGFTVMIEVRIFPFPDHPRSRGVYPPSRYPSRGGPGSSPLARGLRVPAGGVHLALGIIPARAGFTYTSECALDAM